VKVKGRVKVITIKKDEFEKFLQLRKLRILDKEYEALMPPIDSLQKNTIDINGLAFLVTEYLGVMIKGGGRLLVNKLQLKWFSLLNQVILPFLILVTLVLIHKVSQYIFKFSRRMVIIRFNIII
jgi:hypothetical protein